MSQVRVFSLLGDSNIRRHITKTTCRASGAVKGAQVIPCGALEIFSESLKSIRAESNMVILSCVTNFITSAADGPSAVSQRVEPILQDVHFELVAACEENPDRQYFVSPPMYRTSPVWYREGLPEVLTLFSQTLGSDRPANLHVLPSFATPEFETDGVHLTIYSALQFILHLFDSAQEMLEALGSSTPQVLSRGSEATRVLEDRVMVLEQDHRRLNRVLENKIALDSELADFRANERTEDCFVVAGLPAISSDLSGKDWQDQALHDVQGVISILMGREMPILYVKNSTKRYKDAEVTYTVKMQELSDAKAIRRKYGSFFIGIREGSRDKRPEGLTSISIKNFVTPETNTRISILKLLAQKYRLANKGSRVKVIGYEPRPVIKITPAASASDRRVMQYHYVEAVTKLPIKLSSAEVEPILRRINPNLLGKIRSVFVILSDDSFKKLIKPLRQQQPDTRSANATEAMEEGGEAENDCEPEPEPEPERVPEPTPSKGHSSRSSSTSGSRKRVASKGLDGSKAKK